MIRHFNTGSFKLSISIFGFILETVCPWFCVNGFSRLLRSINSETFRCYYTSNRGNLQVFLVQIINSNIFYHCL